MDDRELAQRLDNLENSIGECNKGINAILVLLRDTRMLDKVVGKKGEKVVQTEKLGKVKVKKKEHEE